MMAVRIRRSFSNLTVICPLLSVFLWGCGTTVTAVRLDKVQDVQADIKRQVGVYLVQKNKARIATTAAADGYWCGNGSVDFDISRVKVTLLTVADTTTSGNASGKTSPILTIKPSLSLENVSTSTLVFSEWLEPDGYYSNIYTNPSLNKSSIDDAPIAQALLTLRQGLIAAAQRDQVNDSQLPCFSAVDRLANAGTDPGDTFTIDIKYLVDANGQVSLGIGPFTVGGGVESKITNQNTIQVSFVPSGAQSIPMGKKISLDSKPAVPPNTFSATQANRVLRTDPIGFVTSSEHIRNLVEVVNVASPSAASAADSGITRAANDASAISVAQTSNSNIPSFKCRDPDSPNLIVWCDSNGNVIPGSNLKKGVMRVAPPNE
ncbi:hypothetical protein [Burkholderia sp. AU15512]|uniref:hypothetical protein n=1 Tax=Burkholderia sp. AU15512 TaxID=2015345 RepID=UPI00117F616C|nr:hypothetical protein [Burkholderia sp. AU15512]